MIVLFLFREIPSCAWMSTQCHRVNPVNPMYAHNLYTTPLNCFHKLTFWVLFYWNKAMGPGAKEASSSSVLPVMLWQLWCNALELGIKLKQNTCLAFGILWQLTLHREICEVMLQEFWSRRPIHADSLSGIWSYFSFIFAYLYLIWGLGISQMHSSRGPQGF